MSSDKTEEGQEQITPPAAVATTNDDNTNNTDGDGGRPATAEEQEKIESFLELLRQQNLNVTSIPLNQPSSNGGGTDTSNTNTGKASSGTAANLIADNALEALSLGGNNKNDNAGRKKHAFWDTQVSWQLVG